jgi:transcription termination/antitermination protein NusA
VERNPRGSFIHISRTHPGFMRELFSFEIPEIQDGIIEILSIAREPGKRSKVAVKSNNPAIGAVGTCVGHMGGRIQTIIKELHFEKIDVLEWNEDAKVFIANSLKPAKISQVVITNEADKTATVVVPNDQLSLAIGKNGINVRLSVKLTGWKIDIQSEEEFGGSSPRRADGKNLSIVEKMKRAQEGSEEEVEDDNTPSLLTLKAEEDSESEDAPLSGLAAKLAAEKESSEEKTELKVSALAKDLNLKTKDLMDLAKGFGIEIKSNRSMLTAAEVSSIKKRVLG